MPGLAHSTGSYPLGLMPPEIRRALDVDISVLRRDPHYFLPTPGDPGSPHLVFGGDRDATRAQLARFFSARDAKGGMGAVSAALADAARIYPGTPVRSIALDGGRAAGVVLAGDRPVAARVVHRERGATRSDRRSGC